VQLLAQHEANQKKKASGRGHPEDSYQVLCHGNLSCPLQPRGGTLQPRAENIRFTGTPQDKFSSGTGTFVILSGADFVRHCFRVTGSQSAPADLALV